MARPNQPSEPNRPRSAPAPLDPLTRTPAPGQRCRCTESAATTSVPRPAPPRPPSRRRWGAAPPTRSPPRAPTTPTRARHPAPPDYGTRHRDRADSSRRTRQTWDADTSSRSRRRARRAIRPASARAAFRQAPQPDRSDAATVGWRRPHRTTRLGNPGRTRRRRRTRGCGRLPRRHVRARVPTPIRLHRGRSPIPQPRLSPNPS